MSSSKNLSASSIVLGTTFVVGSISSLGWWYYFTRVNSTNDDPTNHKSKETCSRTSLSNTSQEPSLIKPPFPQPLRDMLSRCQLAYLSTVDAQACSSHLSLMRFTYLHDPEDGEIVIMSTNRNTKKFDMLKQQTGVALLVHDFAETMDGSESNDPAHRNRRRSITLNGICRILSGAAEEKYRKAHLAHNPEYPQFIVGPDIAVLCVDVQSARICDLNDKVVHWNVLQQQQQQQQS